MLQRSTSPTVRGDLSFRDLRLLRAAAVGRVECTRGVEPDYFVDGIPCCDHIAARALARAGLIASAGPATGARVTVRLTSNGQATLAARVA